jgi:hypothetical protein
MFVLLHVACVNGCHPAAVTRCNSGMYFLKSGRSHSYHRLADAQYGSFDAASASKKPGQMP